MRTMIKLLGILGCYIFRPATELNRPQYSQVMQSSVDVEHFRAKLIFFFDRCYTEPNSFGYMYICWASHLTGPRVLTLPMQATMMPKEAQLLPICIYSQNLQTTSLYIGVRLLNR